MLQNRGLSRWGVQDWATTYPLFHWGQFLGLLCGFSCCFAFPFTYAVATGRSFRSMPPLLVIKLTKLQVKLSIYSYHCFDCRNSNNIFTGNTALRWSRVFGFEASTALTLIVLAIIAIVYTISVLIGMEGIIKSASLCTVLLFCMLAYFFFVGGEARYIIETGITSIGNLVQNFIGLSTWMDPLRVSGDGSSGFVQNWTIFYWAYWMAWCVATPFFIGMISKGRTIKNVILGTYGYGLAGTFLSFIVFGNYGLSQQLAGKVDIVSMVQQGTDINLGIIQIFETLPMTEYLLLTLFVMMVFFYSQPLILNHGCFGYSYKAWRRKRGRPSGQGLLGTGLYYFPDWLDFCRKFH